MKKLVFMAAMLAAGAVSAKNMQLPDNVTLKPSGSRSGDFIDTVAIDAPGATFSKVKLCLAQNVRNPTLMIKGGTDAPFSFYSSNQTETTAVQGGDIFKYQDADQNTLIVAGSTDAGTVVLSRRLVRFELMAVAGADKTVLKFSNIEQATESTSIANYGFIPVGAWKGAKPMASIDALQAIGTRVSSCLR